MANLVSPGVQVSVIDESFYTPAEPGTTPMIFVITAQDKTNGSGTATASGTTKAKAGTPYLITSQRELTETEQGEEELPISNIAAASLLLSDDLIEEHKKQSAGISLH